MAVEPGELPTEHLPEHKAFLRRLPPKEARVGGAAALADEALREDLRGMLDEPGESRMAAGKAAPNAAFQRQQVDPKDALADLDA